MAKSRKLILQISFFFNKNDRFMDTEMLVSHSGEPVELKSVVLVAHYRFPCLARGICLSLSHSIVLLVRQTVVVLPSIGFFIFLILVPVGAEWCLDGSTTLRQRTH